MINRKMYWNMWWLRMYGARKGNIYPTHGMGPIAQMMNINMKNGGGTTKVLS